MLELDTKYTQQPIKIRTYRSLTSCRQRLQMCLKRETSSALNQKAGMADAKRDYWKILANSDLFVCVTFFHFATVFWLIP